MRLSFTTCKIFEFKHRISLKDYLEKNYNYKFLDQDGKFVAQDNNQMVIYKNGQDENHFEFLNRDGTKNNSGGVLTWEALRNNSSVTAAIPIVEAKRKGVSDYKTEAYKKSEKYFNLIADRFQFELKSSEKVQNYLEDRGIDWNNLQDDFAIGAVKTYLELVKTFKYYQISDSDLKSILSDLYIDHKREAKPYLPFDKAMVVPVYKKNGDFQGFHGRRIKPGTKPKYFNHAFLTGTAKELLYGEHIDKINQAVKDTDQLILTKGIFDLFACYQSDFKQVYATLNKGITSKQFDKVKNKQCDEIIVGWSSENEKAVISHFVNHRLEETLLRFTESKDDLDVIAKDNGAEGLKSIIEKAKHRVYENKKAVRTKAYRHLDFLKEQGLTFNLTNQEIQEKIKNTKYTHKELQKYLKDMAKHGNELVDGEDKGFVSIPETFIKPEVLSEFKSELRTLLFLYSKRNGNNPVNYKLDNLAEELGLTKRTLSRQIKELVDKKYLMKEKVRDGNNVYFKFYPTLIKFTE